MFAKDSPQWNWGLFWAVLISLFAWSAIANLAHGQGTLPAATGCIGDSVVTLFQPEVLADSLAHGELEAHEAVHRQQMDSIMRTQNVSCFVALVSMTKDYASNLASEAPAYRAQADWNEKHRPGFDRRAFNMAVAKALLFYYESHIPIGVIFASLSGHTFDPYVAEGFDLTPRVELKGKFPVTVVYVTDPLSNRIAERIDYE